VPDLLVEQLLLGELPPERAAEVTRRLEQAGDDRLEALRASDEAILEAYPAAQVVPDIHRRALAERERTPAPRRTLWVGSAALAMAAAAAVTLVVVGPWSGPDRDGAPGFLTDPDTTRIKGLDPALEVYRQEGREAIRLVDDEAVRTGDLVQLSYIAAGHSYGVIYSVDGNGKVTMHHPLRVEGSTALEPDGRTPLERSYELDDAPRFERFVFVAADEPLVVDGVLDTLRPLDLDHVDELAPEELPDGWEISVVTLRKEAE